ncbi:hypothetical protein [Cellulomonas bogoriensis]|uniref:GGDEF domain-containing protein n=1 Tax=Cellulomonas bogoriensis 69B4 = DSM 16987 TaxID=1386082 RepID=A0A0A0BZR9_9CELL|nr:hypothetical protein [Cellulomonas bogoriensis]KGM13177.1 hypothetical protein N869_11885 [Cellulomonas bogoriensis 69B4 = DSM 16987]
MSPTDQLHRRRAERLRERWRERTVECAWLRRTDWYHPAVDALTEAVSVGGAAAPAAYRLGEVRGTAGVGVGETIDDVAVLFDVLGGEPGLEVLRSLCEGWSAAAADTLAVSSTCLEPESGLPTVEYLAVRLAETYGQVREQAVGTHCLVVVDVATVDLAPWRRMARAAAMGQALTAALDPGHPMAALGGGAFTALAPRDDRLPGTVGRIRDQVTLNAAQLQVTDLVRQPPRIWVEQLPPTHGQAVELLRDLAR